MWRAAVPQPSGGVRPVRVMHNEAIFSNTCRMLIRAHAAPVLWPPRPPTSTDWHLTDDPCRRHFAARRV
jgi:hypothetical protein